MALDQKDIEAIECVVYKSGDDIAVAVARSFERMEERIDAMESRTYARISDVEDGIARIHEDMMDEGKAMFDEVRAKNVEK